MQEQQISAEVERITFRNEDNGWTVSRMRETNSNKIITVTGMFGSINEGQAFQLFGTWMQHPQYGHQFKADRMINMRPTQRNGIIKYLASGVIKGVGPKTADKIVEYFGTGTLDILDKQIERLREVPSLGKKKVAAIIESWTTHQSMHAILLFLNTHGISQIFAQKILQMYGDDAVNVVAKEPYRLALDIKGIGFLTADKIAQSLGIAKDSPRRIEAAVIYLLGQAEDSGHCYLTTTQLLHELTQKLQLDVDVLQPKLVAALEELNTIGAVFSQKRLYADEEGDQYAHYVMATLLAEKNTANFLRRLLANPLAVDMQRVTDWLRRYSDQANVELSSDQWEAIKNAASHRVFILTGGPGVGKTTTANTIIRMLKAMGKTVALCAPTGRAAQRLSEVSSEPAKTIHRLLEWNPRLHRFNFDETNPLPVQAVIVDEASMLDIHLANALVTAIADKAQIIFLGDVDQLPSVGAGNFLADLIASGEVPYKRLNKIFRQAHTSHIVQAAHAINHGEMFAFDNKSDCKFIEVETVEQIRGVIKALLLEKLPKETNYHPIHDVQILTPMNRGDLGAVALNNEIQEILNPPRHTQGDVKRANFVFRAGDKVMQGVNNYDLGVFNGDIGYVQACNVDGGKIVVAFGERAVTYKNEMALELRLAYATTIHKSQGSEFPVVILPISMQHFIMLQRNLIYTALTRARRLAIIVGTKKAFGYAISNMRSNERQSLLLPRLQGRV